MPRKSDKPSPGQGRKVVVSQREPNWDRPWSVSEEDFPVRAWYADTQRQLGGYMRLVGIDPVDVFSSKAVKHPLVGRRVKLPMGYATVIRCLTHPRGRIMFDVLFERPVPHFWVRLSRSTPPDGDLDFSYRAIEYVKLRGGPECEYRLFADAFRFLLRVGARLCSYTCVDPDNLRPQRLLGRQPSEVRMSHAC